jgi:MoaA/NifB/PqqE/SkfB family radical SAM enzyme
MQGNEDASRRTYRVTRIPELKNLEVEVEAVGERLKTRVNGIFSPWLLLFIKKYFSSHTSLGSFGTRNGGNVYSLYFPPIPGPAHERTFESVLSTLIYKRAIPLAATIGVTGRCQYSCAHCSAAGRSPDRPDMSLQEIRRVIGECLDLGVSNITFTGGEPLLRKDLSSIIASVPREKAVCQVFTNGALLTAGRIAGMADAGIYGIQVSLDSPDPEENDRMRGSEGAFAAVEQGIKEAHRAGLLVGLSTYASRSRVKSGFLLHMAKLAADWGVNEISVFDAIETGRMRGKKDQMLDRDSRRRLLAEMKAVNQLYRGRLRVVTQSWTNSGRSFSRFIGCLAAKFQLHITAQGDLTPCDFTPLSFGNIRDSSVSDLWQGLLLHPAYRRQTLHCRMQDPAFRRQYIETIPENADLPFRMEPGKTL